jgi:hypothetical protein
MSKPKKSEEEEEEDLLDFFCLYTLTIFQVVLDRNLQELKRNNI